MYQEKVSTPPLPPLNLKTKRCLSRTNVYSDPIIVVVFMFLAHQSRRLSGELIGYPWIRRSSSTFSKVFSSETAWPIKAKFYVEPPWEGGTKVYINGPGHMTKMAAMPIYGKKLKKSSPEPAGRFS